VSGAGRASDVLCTRPTVREPTLCTYCSASNPVDPNTLHDGFTRWLAGCDRRCSVSLRVRNVCVGQRSPTLAGAYTANVAYLLIYPSQSNDLLIVCLFVYAGYMQAPQRKLILLKLIILVLLLLLLLLPPTKEVNPFARVRLSVCLSARLLKNEFLSDLGHRLSFHSWKVRFFSAICCRDPTLQLNAFCWQRSGLIGI